MATIAENLNSILSIKEEIKQAIIDQGVTIGEDDNFATYPSKIASIEGSGTETAKFAPTTVTYEGQNTITSLDLSNLDTSNITSMDSMFSGCTSLTTLNLGDNWDMSSVTSTSAMFNLCSSLTTINGTISGIKSSINLSVTQIPNADILFNGLETVTTQQTLTLPSTAVYTQEQLDDATAKNWSIQGGQLYVDPSLVNMLKVQYADSTPKKIRVNNKLITVTPDENHIVEYTPTEDVTDVNNLFVGTPFQANTPTKIIKMLDLSKVTNTSGILGNAEYNISNLDSIEDLKDWDVSNVTNMRYMFKNANVDLTDVKYWDTSSVIDLYQCFDGASNLYGKTLDLSNWDLSNVEWNGIEYLFFGCNPSHIILNLANATSIQSFNSLFGGCYYLQSITFKNADFSNISNWVDTFNTCQSLTEIVFENCVENSIPYTASIDISTCQSYNNWTSLANMLGYEGGEIKINGNQYSYSDAVEIANNKGWTVTNADEGGVWELFTSETQAGTPISAIRIDFSKLNDWTYSSNMTDIFLSRDDTYGGTNFDIEGPTIRWDYSSNPNASYIEDRYGYNYQIKDGYATNVEGDIWEFDFLSVIGVDVLYYNPFLGTPDNLQSEAFMYKPYSN